MDCKDTGEGSHQGKSYIIMKYSAFPLGNIHIVTCYTSIAASAFVLSCSAEKTGIEV